MTEPTAITELVGRFMERLHLGDLGYARYFTIQWNRGGITRPTQGKFHRDKVEMRQFAGQFRTLLSLPVTFSGEVAFHVNQGKVEKAVVT